MTDSSQIKRICSACGVEKPIVAFLQITGKQGTTYGSICASCRAAGRTAKQATTTDEDPTTTTTDKRIGAKEKVFLEHEKIRQQKDLKELYIKEAKKREEEAVSKIEQADLKEKAAKEHRKFYIETKSIQSFLSQKKFGDASSSIENIIEQNTKQLENIKNQSDKIEKYKQEDIIKQEFQMTSLDFSVPFIAGQTSQLRFHSDTFLKFKAWLGGSSPLIKTLDMLYQQHTHTQPTKSSIFEHKSEHPKQDIDRYLDQRSETPSSRRR